MLGFFTGDKTRDQQDFSLGGRGTEWCARWRYRPSSGAFGTAGILGELIDGLIEQGARELTVVNNNAGNGDTGLAALLKAGRVRKVICSFPRQVDSQVFDALYRSGQLELELVPQGNLAERLRAAGAGIGAFFTPTGFGTELARNADGSEKETRVINGKSYVLEYPILGDVALIKAERGDRWGQPHLPQGRAELWPGDGHRRETHHRQRVRDRRTRQLRPRGRGHARHPRERRGAHPRVATQAGGFKTAPHEPGDSA